ncbi:protein melted-like [Pollicipes pollicipes]|uniref:protein melted-like n=1 Tax=Pollicipes pollicipes TaxID=41117 RepID=UPI001884D91B|nr:protein melted-like [Pollicipes pollicipes]
MHELFRQVLNEKDLSRAGELFSLDDEQVVGDLQEVIKKILEVTSRPEFLNSINEQSVVEIAITRVTSAVRDTQTIEGHAAPLVQLLESCLQHDLKPSDRDEDPPHAKMASDVLACLFLNYGRPSVMQLAMPVAVRFLVKGSRELSRNLAAYLSLVAIENAQLIADHAASIMDSIAAGNYQLTQVLPPIYRLQPDRFARHMTTLVTVMPLCLGQERLALIDLFQLMAKQQPQLLVPAVPQLCDYLCSPPLGAATAQVLTTMTMAAPLAMSEHVNKLKLTVDHQPATLPHVLPVLVAFGQRTSRKPRLYLSTEETSRRLSEDNCVTIVKVGSGGSRELWSTSSRDLLSSRDHLRGKLADSSRSTPRLNQSRPIASATSTSLIGLKAPLHKSMTQVNHSSQLITRFPGGSRGQLPASQRALTSLTRISVFEPYQMRDTMQHFCEKHLDKIKEFMQKVSVRLPLPGRCTIEERKSRKQAKLHFMCQIHGEYCLYNKSFYPMKTKNPRTWIHLMFLTLQARASSALSSRDPGPNSLKNCWDTLRWESTSFLEVVTGCFPTAKETDVLLQELRSARFFDVFEYNGMQQQWGCFLCNHPEKAEGFVKPDQPVMEGQLKEKKGRWKIFQRWRTRYFTLSGAHLSYRCSEQPRLDNHEIGVHEIRSVKVSRSGRNIPKAFEIFTHDRTYVLKAKDGKKTEEWVRCLSVAVAHQHSRPRADTISLGVNSVANLHSMPQLATL